MNYQMNYLPLIYYQTKFVLWKLNKLSIYRNIYLYTCINLKYIYNYSMGLLWWNTFGHCFGLNWKVQLISVGHHKYWHMLTIKPLIGKRKHLAKIVKCQKISFRLSNVPFSQMSLNCSKLSLCPWWCWCWCPWCWCWSPWCSPLSLATFCCMT